MATMKTFSGLFEFEIEIGSAKGKRRPLTEEEELEYCYESDLSDAISAYVDKFLEEQGVEKASFQVETYKNNGGPLIDYSITLKTDEDKSPMYKLWLGGLSVPVADKGRRRGWRLGTSAGGVRSEEVEEKE